MGYAHLLLFVFLNNSPCSRPMVSVKKLTLFCTKALNETVEPIFMFGL
jgi:hypothetical protein